MNSLKYLASVIYCVVLGSSQLSAAQSQTDPALQQAKAEFRQAKEEKHLELNAEKFRLLQQQNPSMPLLMVYSGAATSKLAMTTVFPWKKLSYAEEGLAMIDKALILFARQKNDVSAEIEGKFIAANTFLAVPDFMNRQPRGQQLLDEISSHKELNNIDPHLHAAILYKAAQQASKTKNFTLAKQYLQQVLALQTELSPQAQTMLKGLPI